MKNPTICGLTLFAGSSMLAGCAFTIPGAGAVAGAPDRSASWISAQAKAAQRLLYVSDLGTFTVKIYDFPSLRPAGKLTGFDNPQGLCTGAHGSVWVANTSTAQIFEFVRGETKREATLSDPVGYPAGCAFDPKSGDLAVTNIADFSGNASVVVYKGAHGTPAVYRDSAQSADYFAGYDAGGELYVSGISSHGSYVLTLLPRGARRLLIINVTGGTIFFPGTVAWEGSTLVLGDQRCQNRAGSCLYEATVTGKTARITGTIPLDGACDVAQAWVGASEIAGGDDQANCKYGTSTVDVWPYPGGGKPKASATGVRMPVGATVSAAGAP